MTQTRTSGRQTLPTPWDALTQHGTTAAGRRSPARAVPWPRTRGAPGHVDSAPGGRRPVNRVRQIAAVAWEGGGRSPKVFCVRALLPSVLLPSNYYILNLGHHYSMGPGPSPCLPPLMSRACLRYGGPLVVSLHAPAPTGGGNPIHLPEDRKFTHLPLWDSCV